jgi:hypothetical protein
MGNRPDTWQGITRLSGTDDAEAVMQFLYTNQRRMRLCCRASGQRTGGPAAYIELPHRKAGCQAVA